ncbi:MAG: ATP-binding protein, partial [Ignavibacteriaceae bacterium]|nr:ATP-binding protein [Ignavibacteriaceae bacterium]
MRDPTKYCGLIFILLFFLSFQTLPQTHIPTGNVNGKWLKQNSTYFIDGEIKIPRGKKLVIEAGVKVIFTGHYKFIVSGILEAKGTKQDSIYFFPSDTSVGWHGIRFIEADDFSTLAYCVLRNGKTDRVLEDGDYEKCKADPDCDENDYDGGAILIIHSHPIISNCLITDNQSAMHGAITIKNKSNPQINFCEIKDNIGGEGSGIHCENNSNPILKNSIISGNIGGMGAGISFQDYCSPIIDGCIIKNNTSDYRAGGICFYTNSKPVVRNSIISNNKAILGGGIFIDEFYNLFREQPEKIDIQITNTRIENNSAEYGGGVWLRDAVGKFNGVTVCNNKASIAGGGIHIEYNPFLFKFSSENPCNVFMNFARIMGNDLFRLGGGNPMAVPLDTFTVKYYSNLNAEPVIRFPITLKNFKLTQVNADLYVSPEGDDNNSGQSPDESLKTLRIALLRILADSTNPRTIYMGKGEYVFNETNDILLLGKHKYVSVKGAGFTDVIFGTDRITVFTPWWITTWALIIYSSIVIGIIILIVNVRTRRFKIKSELDKKEFEAKKLHEVDEIKTRFFTNISHEFRTPLTLILGPAKQLSEQLKDEVAKTKADLIHRSAKNLNRLVDELLDISKIESGEMKLKACPLNLLKIVKESALSFSSLAERKRITFNINSTVGELITYVDKNKVDKILSNVLSNAFKFTPEMGRVEVGIDGNAKFAEISIIDTGIGIPQNQLDKIFDRFYQVDGSHTREHEGTGIGLALTKELVELHKGRIEVESKEGKGSKFKIIFQLGKAHLR